MSSNDSVPARIGRGLRFNGTNAFVDFGTMDFGNNFTIRATGSNRSSRGIASTISTHAEFACRVLDAQTIPTSKIVRLTPR